MFRIEAVRDGPPMLARAAHSGSRIEGAVLADGNGARARRMAMRGRLLRRILHHAIAEGIIQLIHVRGIIGSLARLAAFENHYRKCGARRNLFSQCEADEAAAGYYNIDGLELLHGVWQTSLHRLDVR